MDATRPSLKRLTDPAQITFSPLPINPNNASSPMWFGSFSDRLPSSSPSPSLSRPTRPSPATTTSSQPRLSSDLPLPLSHPSQDSPHHFLAKGKGKASAPLAENIARLKGAKDVLIHVIDKHDTIAGIALSYGISLSALRKANGMWTSDPLSLKDTLRIPLELCNLPPSKKIEIEQDSGKVLIWEQSSAFSSSSSSSPPRRKSTNGLWAHQNGQASGPFRDAHYSTQRFSSHHSHNSSQISLEMSTNTGTSSETGPSPKRESFNWHSQALGPLCAKDEFPDYLTATNHNYRNSSQCPSPPAPLDAGIPLARNPGILTSICNSTSPPPQPNTHHPKVIATLERVPARELGFFPSAAPVGPETTTTLLPDLSAQATLNFPSQASSTLRQRSATSSSLLPASTSQRQLATSHNSHSTSTSTPTTIASPRPRIPTKLHFDSQPPHTLSNDDDVSQTSPGLEKKKLVPSQARYPTFSSPCQKSTMASSTRSTSSSKWTTVRPGVPPPLDRRLKFLEEGSTGALGSLFQSALNPLLGQQQESQPPHMPLNLSQGHEERVELVRLPAKEQHEQGSFWGFWDDLLDEADQARRK